MTMRKLILTACFLTIGANAYSEVGPPKNLGMLFSYSTWSRLQDQAKSRNDIVVLSDGSHLYGQLENLPVLHYAFGDITFHDGELTTIAIAHEGTHSKIQCITLDGQNFISDIPKEPFIFLELTPLAQRVKIDPRDISVIMLRENKDFHSTKNPKLVSLEFKNGNQLPVVLVGDTIHLSDGRQEFHICCNNLRELSFMGGIVGWTEDEKKELKRIGFSFVKDKYVAFYIPKTQQTVKFPWDQIATLQGQNGGFNREWVSEGELPFLQPSALNTLGVKNEKQANLLKKAVGSLLKDSVQLTPEQITLYNEELIFEDVPKNPIAIEDIELKDPDPDDDDSDDATSGIKFLTDADETEEQTHVLTPQVFNQVKDILIAEELIYLDDFPEKESSKEDDGKDLETENIQFLTFEELRAETDLLVSASGELVPIIAAIHEEEINRYSAQDHHALDQAILLEQICWQESFEKEEMNTSEESLSDEKGSSTEKASEPQVASNAEVSHEMAYISSSAGDTAFYVDRSKVSNEEYMQFVKAMHYHAPVHWVDGKIPLGIENKPVVNVSYKDALTYAVWKGKRLPTESEWQKALNAKVLDDSDDQVDEWTSTGTSQVPFVPQRLVKHRSGEQSTVLNIDAFNSHTGFRLANEG